MIRHAKTWKSADGFPIAVPIVNLAWLAFCSGDYLKRDGRLVALPLNDLHHCPDRYAYRDITTTFEDAGGLPRTMDLFTSKERFLASHTQWDKEMSFGSRYTEWNQKTAAKIQDGLLMFHYAVTETTNVLGRTFPLKFEFFQCGRPYEENANWLTTGTGQVTSIHSVDQAK
jgi:hypothetical protein